jgi:4-azaleucine resistance transporter AzlC
VNPRQELLEGFKDIAPMMLAYAPIAALWGAIAASKELDPLQTLAMSAFVYSGASQFIAMDLWASPVPLVTILLALVVVNLRHVLMSASISRHMSFGRTKTTGLLYWLTDEAWAMMERRALTDTLTPAYCIGVSLPIWPTWFAFSVLGNVLGGFFKNTDVIGLDFAFSAMFIAVVAGFWKGKETGAVIAASAVAAVLAKLYLPGTWYILSGAFAGMIIAVLFPAKESRA